MTTSNALLGIAPPIPFDRVAAADVQPAIAALLDQARARIEEIAAAPGERTWTNTMGALDTATDPLDLAVAVVRHLEGVVTTPELRAAWNEAQPGISAFYSGIPLHAGLWAALNEYAATDEAKSLIGVRARFLTKTLDAFRRHGAALPPEDKKKLEELDVELAVTTNKFAQNVLDATAAFEYYIEDEAGLAGLPPSAVSAARAAAEAKGRPGWRFSLQAPSYLAVMTYLDDGAVREKFYRAYGRRAAEANSPLIVKILDLRRRKAELLGFPSFADFALVERMAKTGRAAQEFCLHLRGKTEPAFQRENAALESFAGRKLEPWDIAYYAEKQRADE